MALSLINLERALRQGKTPESLKAEFLQKGAQKAGYLYITSKGMKVVIKLDSGGYNNSNQKRPPDLTSYGCKTIYQTLAGKYIIQEYVTPLRMRGSNVDNVPTHHPAWDIFWKINRHEGYCSSGKINKS